MKVDSFGLTIDAAGWQARVTRRAPTTSPALSAAPALDPVGTPTSDLPLPVLHAATIDLPSDLGDLGGALVPLLGADDVFLALLEYAPDLADTGLFSRVGVPRLAPSMFSGARMPRYVPGRSASQQFFSVGHRAFCLYVVIGSHARRMILAARADAVVRSLTIADRQSMASRVARGDVW